MPDNTNKEKTNSFIPTMNKTGYMTSVPDEFSQRFIEYAASNYPELSLEIGAAFGVTTHAALKAGANMVVNDLDERHIKILIEKTPPELRHHLHPVVAKVPELAFLPESFSAILACRILHFLDGPNLRDALQYFANWLKPGGKLFLVADTPFVKCLEPFMPKFLQRLQEGEAWPGYIEDISKYVPDRAKDIPTAFHALEPILLTREVYRAGLIVEEARLFSRPDYPDDLRNDGRESVGIIATKPNTTV